MQRSRDSASVCNGYTCSTSPQHLRSLRQTCQYGETSSSHRTSFSIFARSSQVVAKAKTGSTIGSSTVINGALVPTARQVNHQLICQV